MPKPWKNVDGQALADAVQACDLMAFLVGDLIDSVDHLSPGGRARMLGKIGTLLATQRSALAEMQRIRTEMKHNGRAK
jgi:hypothetical protein